MQHDVWTARQQKYRFARDAKLEEQPTATQRGLYDKVRKVWICWAERQGEKTCSITARAWIWWLSKQVFMVAILVTAFSHKKDGVCGFCTSILELIIPVSLVH
jgi:hypothetical protein